MTVAAFVALVRSMSMGRYPIAMTFRASPSYLGDGVAIGLGYSSPDATSSDGAPIAVAAGETVESFMIEHMTEDHAIDFLRQFVRRAVLHEMDEFLVIGGKRWDPHEHERAKPAGALDGPGARAPGGTP